MKPKLHKSKSTLTFGKSGPYQKHSPRAPLSNGTTTSIDTNVRIPIMSEKIIYIVAKYYLNQLTQIHYYGHKKLPREIFKMIASIVQLYPTLTNITINNGLDVFGIYEISKLLNVSRITEVCLEHLDIKNAHFYLFLTEASNLSYLSLSRCTINDEIVENIISQLIYPLPASKTLIALNLSCNLITDRGVYSIGKALRSNRCLQYLNLAGNMITDYGAAFLFDSLMKFPLTDHEESERNKSYVQYCINKVSLMTQFFTESNSQPLQKRESKLVRRLGKKSKKADDITLHAENITVQGYSDHEKAKAFAENILGQFRHPYDNKNVVREDGIGYCLGNNTLCYLNLAYNNLMLNSIHKLRRILTYQNISGRTPRGLTRVVIEGNPVPSNCAEVHDLNHALESLLDIGQKNRVGGKKPKHNKACKVKDSFHSNPTLT